MEQDARKQDKEQEAWLRLPSVSATCLARWRLVFYSNSSCRLECFHSGATSRARMFVERVSNRSACARNWCPQAERWFMTQFTLGCAQCCCKMDMCIHRRAVQLFWECLYRWTWCALFRFLQLVRPWLTCCLRFARPCMNFGPNFVYRITFVAGVPRVLAVVPSIGLPAAQRDKLRPTRCRHCIPAFHFAYMRVMFAKHWTLPSECLMSWCSWW